MRALRLSLIAALAVLSLACDSAEKAELDRGEIQVLLEAYCPALSAAYETGDLSLLEGMAAEKEIAAVAKRIDELDNSGRTLVATFDGLTIEDVDVWNYANAFVSTLENWDLRLYATGATEGEPLSQDLDQRQRVHYQLKRDEGRWLVLYRSIET